MKLLITALLALLAAIGLGILLSREAGSVIFTWHEWTIQTSTGFFTVALLLAVALIYFTIHLLIGLVRFPHNLRRWSELRRNRRSERLLKEGLTALLQQDWHAAESAFRAGAIQGTEPALNFLLAARAAQQLGATDRRDRYLQNAREQDAGADLAVGLARAESHMQNRQFGLAWSALRDLDAREPGNEQVKRLLLEAGAELREWPLVLELLPGVERAKALPPERLKSRRLEAWAGLLRDAGGSGNVQKLEEQWGKIPRRARREISVLETYVQERLKYSGSGGCEDLLRRAIIQTWDRNLVILFGLVEGKDPRAQLRTAEAWLAGHEGDPALLLTLGRLARRCELWGKARAYLEECIERRPGPDACRELAAVLEEMGEKDAAAERYVQGLKLVTDRGPAARNLLMQPAPELPPNGPPST